jgi:hypothetical protein
VITEVTIITDGVCPATEADGVTMIIEVCTSVTGGTDEAVKTRVETGGGGGVELAGGAADEAGGGGALEAGGRLDDAGGGLLDDAGGGATEDAGGGGGEEGASAEEGGLEGAGAAEDGAGAAVGAAEGVTGRTDGDEGARGDEVGVEGTITESNVLAVPLPDMSTTIAARNGRQAAEAKKNRQATTTTEKRCRGTPVKGCEDVSAPGYGRRKLGRMLRKNGRLHSDLGALQRWRPWIGE